MKSINIIAIMPFLASSFMTQAPVYQDVNHPIGDRVVGGKLTANKKVMSVDETITFSLAVKNTGNREGQEIVQLYIRDIKSSLPRSVKELKRFKKVKLMPGEEKIVSLSIDKEALSFFDAEKHEWICEPGKFEAIIAASAMDIKDVLKFELK